jgi:hypothetical protein
VISDGLWRSRFAAAPDIVGRKVMLSSRPFTIVGVMPAGFRFPIKAPAAEIWVTLAEDARVERSDDSPMTTERGASPQGGRLRRGGDRRAQRIASSTPRCS